MKKFFILFIISITMLPYTISAWAKSESDTVELVSADKLYVQKTDGALYSITGTSFWHEHLYDGVFMDFEPNDIKITKIADGVATFSQNYILTEDGTVINADSGEAIMDDTAAISSANGHTLIVKNDGTLWGFGKNNRGQLAQGALSKSVQQQLEENLKHKNDTVCEPETIYEPVQIMENVKAAVAYEVRSIVLKNDGTVWTFGYDYDYSLGRGYKYIINNEPMQILSDTKQVFVSGSSSFAIDNNDTLWRWGSIYTGYAGGSDNDIKTPQKYVDSAAYAANVSGFNLIIHKNGELWVYGNTADDAGDYPFSKTPVMLAENVAAAWYAGNSSEDLTQTIFVLKNNHDLMLMTIPDPDNSDQITFEKITGNVRLLDGTLAVKNFVDISEVSDEQLQSINLLAKAQIISGTSETEFSPDKPISRAEIAALLLRMTAKDDESGNGGFSDVTANDWYYNTAGASKKYNIVAGFEDNTFRGNDIISKVQFISLVARTLRSEGHVSETDTEPINAKLPEWAADDISLAFREGLLNETELADMDSDMTRADAAVVLYRLYGKI